MPVKVVSERCARRDAVGAVTRQGSQTHIGDAHRNLIVQQRCPGSSQKRPNLTASPLISFNPKFGFRTFKFLSKDHKGALP